MKYLSRNTNENLCSLRINAAGFDTFHRNLRAVRLVVPFHCVMKKPIIRISAFAFVLILALSFNTQIFAASAPATTAAPEAGVLSPAQAIAAPASDVQKTLQTSYFEYLQTRNGVK